MRSMTLKEITRLRKDLKRAKIIVLHKHGFSPDEIAAIVGIPGPAIVRVVADHESNMNRIGKQD